MNLIIQLQICTDTPRLGYNNFYEICTLFWGLSIHFFHLICKLWVVNNQ